MARFLPGLLAWPVYWVLATLIGWGIIVCWFLLILILPPAALEKFRDKFWS